MNVHDSEHMVGILESLSYTPAESEQDAHLILVNTCAIRDNAEQKVFGLLWNLRTLKLQRPGLIIGFCGCMSQEEGVVEHIMTKHPHVDLVMGTHNIHRLPYLLEEALFSKEAVIEVWSKEGDIIENMPKVRSDNLRAWVNIMYGCDKFCTYCIVPYTRGKERSRRPQDVLDEVRQLACDGYQEITLLGQNVNAYGKDLQNNYTFANLMADIYNLDIPRVRFTTSHPYDFDDDLINVLALGGNLVEHIHLPVQSGSSDILKIMARKYTREQYLCLVDKIYKTVPNASLTTDIIVGFPGETKEQFEQTISLIEEVQYDSAFTFIYSARAGTPAAKMADAISMEEKRERLARLNDLQNSISLQKSKLLRGQVLEVLVEGSSKKKSDILAGRTRSNKVVHFAGSPELIGTMVDVEITNAKTWTLDGHLVRQKVTSTR